MHWHWHLFNLRGHRCVANSMTNLLGHHAEEETAATATTWLGQVADSELALNSQERGQYILHTTIPIYINVCVYILYLVGAEQLSSSQDDKTLLWPTERGFYNLSRPFCRRKRFDVYQQSKWAPLLTLSPFAPSLPDFISSPSFSLIEKRLNLKRCSGGVFRSLISQLKRINCKRETREETND